ncbi:hypothetical protein [Diaphorobacter sp.]|uniref:hypothetical protein n=1 Tax=Diaphorobacter sp. TaxID=1934310 RepID=UPI00258316FF|nr:hypothetical protein [Diaphorobacter sp.]
MELEWKKIVLYAIVPSCIAGLFSVAPKFYDIATEPKAELTFDAVVGPELQTAAGYQKIVSVTIENTGARPLTSVYGSVAFEGGKLEASKVNGGNALKPTVSSNAAEVSFSVPKVHPGEKLTISAMGVVTRAAASPVVTVRSDETLGTEKKIEGKRVSSWQAAFNSLLGGVVASIAAFFAISLWLLRTIGVGAGSKQDLLVFIPARLGMVTVLAIPNLQEASFRHLADRLLAVGLDPQWRPKAVTALKCMLLIKDMQSTSLKIVEQNLRMIGGPVVNDEVIAKLKAASMEMRMLMELRSAMDEVVVADGVTTGGS